MKELTNGLVTVDGVEIGTEALKLFDQCESTSIDGCSSGSDHDLASICNASRKGDNWQDGGDLHVCLMLLDAGC